MDLWRKILHHIQRDEHAPLSQDIMHGVDEARQEFLRCSSRTKLISMLADIDDELFHLPGENLPEAEKTTRRQKLEVAKKQILVELERRGGS